MTTRQSNAEWPDANDRRDVDALGADDANANAEDFFGEWDGDDDGGLAWRGAKLVLTCGDRLLVLRRDDIPTINWPGMWDLPGGAREGDESPQACARRELLEETGLRLDPARLGAAHARELPHKPGRAGWYFHAEITPAEAASAVLGDEGAELRLMPVAEFVSHPQAVPHFRGIVAEMLGL